MFFEWLVRKKYKKQKEDIQEKFESYQKILEITDVFEAHEKKLNSIIESQKEMLCRFLPDTTLTFVNYAFYRAFGTSEKELIGRNFKELITKENEEKLTNIIDELNVGNPSKLEEFRIVNNNEIKWYEWSINIIIQEDKIVEYQAVGRDITEKKEAQERLSKALEDYDTLLNNVETFIWYMTDPETMGAVNQSFADFFGYNDRKKVIGTKLKDMMCQEDYERCLGINQEIFKFGRTIKTEEWVTSSTGEKRLWAITKKPKENGHVQYIVASAIDITDKKTTEKKYELLVNQSQTIIYTVSFEGIITYISPSCEISVGFKPEEIIGKHYTSFINTEDFNDCNIFIETNDNKTLNIFEYRVLNKNGETRFHRTIISPVYDEVTNLRHYIGNSIDVTDKIEYEKKLKQQNKLLDSVLESQPDYVVRYDKDHKILYANSVYCDLFFNGKDCLGETLQRELVDLEDVHKIDLYLRKIYESEIHKAETDIQIKIKDGEYRFFHIRGIGITDDDNNVVEIQSVGRDLTCKIEMERQLNYRNQLLESVLKAQIDFVVRLDENKKILYMNDIYRSSFFNEKNSNVEVFENLVHPDDQKLLEDHFHKVFNSPYMHEIDVRLFNTLKNDYLWYHISTVGIFDNNKVIELQSVGRDITDRYNLQKKLNHKNQLLKNILETQTDCIARCDLNRIVLFANRAYSITFCGVDNIESCVSIDFLEQVYPDDCEMVKSALKDLIENPPHKISAEYRVIDYNGNVRFFRWQAQGILDEFGKVCEIQGIGRDVADIIKWRKLVNDK